jgi:Nickel responsive protein SCO4226-like
MPLYLDHHNNLEGLTPEAVAEDHKKDLEVQHKHGAKALRYWFNEEKGEVYCLFEAPNAEAAEAVHREAHGNVADEITEVKEGTYRRREGQGRKPWPFFLSLFTQVPRSSVLRTSPYPSHSPQLPKLH